MSELLLPRIFEDKTEDNRYTHLNGKPKLSYSQFTSWKSDQYRAGYIKQYMAKIELPSGIFAQYGSEVGEYKEWLGNGQIGNEPENSILTDADKEFLRSEKYPENSKYEDLILVDCGNFVIEGYIDRCIYLPDNKVVIQDFKTGGEKKIADYASPDYGQTTLYCYDKVQNGYDIERSEVILYDRKGNGRSNAPMRLTGKTTLIPTPYSEERAEKLLKDISKTALEISNYYTQFLKFFK